MVRRSLLSVFLTTFFISSGCTSAKTSGWRSAKNRKSRLDKCPALQDYLNSLCVVDRYRSKELTDGMKTSGSSGNDFYIGKYPVTVEMWSEFVSDTHDNFPIFWNVLSDLIVDPNGKRHMWPWMPPVPESDTSNGIPSTFTGWSSKRDPIVNVRWGDCLAFAEWATELSGIKLRLPLEAEWEFAARGGHVGQKYPWGNDFDLRNLWCSKITWGDRGKTGAIDRTEHIWTDHPFGLIDMVGNVNEWCLDVFDENKADYGVPMLASPTSANNDEDHINSRKGINPKSNSMTTKRVVRGGTWFDPFPEFLTCSVRWPMSETVLNNSTGFRLCTRR